MLEYHLKGRLFVQKFPCVDSRVNISNPTKQATEQATEKASFAVAILSYYANPQYYA